MKGLFFLIFSLLSCLSLAQAQLPADCSQVILGVTKDWKSTTVQLSVLQKDCKGQWQQMRGPYQGRLGRAGLVWGLGLQPNIKGSRIKKEGDGCSPAGIFSIGSLFLSMNQKVYNPFRLNIIKVSPYDLWVSDMNQPHLYNRHVRLDHPATSAWERKEQRRQNDYAPSLKLESRHNAADVQGRPIVGAGSSIFFHLWRNNGKSVTAGCTSMAEDVLRCFLSVLDPRRKPVYILLPKAEYLKYRKAWNLP